MRHTLGIGLVVVLLTLAGCGPLLAGDLSLAGGLTFAGKALSYDVAASYPLLLNPVQINGKLLYSPVVNEAAVALATPISTFTKPLGEWLKWDWAPVVNLVAEKVEVGVSAWTTNDRFPVRGGLFWQLNALNWEF
jgi:hypothetical protein